MALQGVGSLLAKSPGRFISGSVGMLRSNFNKPGMLAGRFESMDERSAGLPGGHLAPSSWFLPRKSGGLSTVNEINGAATLTAFGALGLNGDAALVGSGNITSALLALVVSAVASLSGSGSLSASIVGKLEAAAALAGSGNLAGSMGALASLIANLSGAGSLAAVPRADGALSANLRGYGDLTPEGIRDAVWNAVAAQYVASGTFGATLNAAGSGGVDYGALGDAVRAELGPELLRILELALIHGLVPGSPLTVSATDRAAGSVAQTIGESAGTVTVTRT